MKSRSNDSFSELQNELEAQDKQGGGFDDARFWYPERDKEGNGAAIIRFLPTSEGDKVPMMKFFSHNKKFDGGSWYIHECPTTIGKECPLCEANDTLWKSGEQGQAEVRNNRKRKMRYVTNILVVKDPANPENEGKNFLFSVGFKLHGKIMEAMKGIEDELEPENSIAPCNVFDFWAGKNFSLKIHKVDGQTNYDKSAFAKKPTPLHTFDANGKAVKWDDTQLEALWNKQYKLKADYADKLEYHEYDDLKAKLDKAMGIKVKSAAKQAEAGATETAKTEPTVDASSGTTTEATSAQTEDDFFDNL